MGECELTGVMIIAVASMPAKDEPNTPYLPDYDLGFIFRTISRIVASGTRYMTHGTSQGDGYKTLLVVG